jgi:hypothetical protein
MNTDPDPRVPVLERELRRQAAELRQLRAHLALLERLAPNAPGVNGKWGGPLDFPADGPPPGRQ